MSDSHATPPDVASFVNGQPAPEPLPPGAVSYPFSSSADRPDRPELTVGATFFGALLLARLLKRRAR